MPKPKAKLEPCPFCKSEDLDLRYYFYPYWYYEKKDQKGCRVICNICKAQGPEARSEKAAIKKWNKRAEE